MAISADIKLDIYNDALTHLGSRTLASLAEDREPRRVLDQWWGANDKVVRYALERGDWNFALRAVQQEPDAGIEPAFGWTYAYSKPEDFMRLNSLSASERFETPLTYRGYTDQAGYWWSDVTPLYVLYVSSDGDYGFDSGKWTEGFKEFIALYLAFKSMMRLTSDKGLRDRIAMDWEKALKNAKSVDAMQDGVKFLPSGSWVRSRTGGNRTRDRSRSIPS